MIGQSAASPALSRATRTSPQRLSGRSAAGVGRIKDRVGVPGGSSAGLTQHASGRTGLSSLNLTLGSVGRRHTRLLHLGRDAGGLHVDATLLRHDRGRFGHLGNLGHHGPHLGFGLHHGLGLHHGHFGHVALFGHHYPHGHYYHGYHPLYYSYPHYYPFYGYRYACAYYPGSYYVYNYYGAADADAYPDAYGDAAALPADGAYDAPPPDGAPSDAEAYPAAPEGELKSLVGEGVSAFTQGRYDEARSLFVSAMLADERDGHAKLLYSLANAALGDYRVAAAALRRALLTTPELVGYPLDVRTLYENPLEWESHLSDLTKYTSDHPDDREGRFLLGYLLYAAGEPLQALDILEALAGSDPEDDLASQLAASVKDKLPAPDPAPVP